LQAGLTVGTLGARRGEVWPSCEFSNGDGADRHLIGKGGGDTAIVPIDEHRSVQETGGHLRAADL
jgi:hypothetical protein